MKRRIEAIKTGDDVMNGIGTILTEVAQRYSNYIANFSEVSRASHPNDELYNEHYLNVGKSAIGAIAASLCAAGFHSPKRVLDLACGYGRVARHLRIFFPDSELVCCDLYPEMVTFCSESFDCKGVESKEDLSKLMFDNPFDLIWCGSLLTHTDKYLFREGLELMRRSVANPGLVVCTLQGRQAVKIQNNDWKVCDDNLFRPAERELYRAGFAFIDTHSGNERSQQVHYLNAQFGGGFAYSMPSYVAKFIEDFDDVCLYMYREAGWNWHQDVLAFGKPGIY